MKEKLRKSRNISKKTGISGIIICLVALVVLAIEFINPDLYNEVSKTLFENENNSLNASASNTSIVNDNDTDVDVKVNITNPESLKDVTIKTSKKITSEFVSNEIYYFYLLPKGYHIGILLLNCDLHKFHNLILCIKNYLSDMYN